MADQTSHQKVNWRSRIVKTGKILASQITPHPDNPRRHPQIQREAVAASFQELGQIAPIIINANNGYLVDGEERSWLALFQEGDVEVDAIWVDLTEEEHRRALLLFDASGELAYYDGEKLDELMAEFETENIYLQKMLADLSAGNPKSFSPNLSPNLGSEVITSDDMKKADEKLQNAFNNPKKLQSIMCPHCGGEFYLDEQ